MLHEKPQHWRGLGSYYRTPAQRVWCGAVTPFLDSPSKLRPQKNTLYKPSCSSPAFRSQHHWQWLAMLKYFSRLISEKANLLWNCGVINFFRHPTSIPLTPPLIPPLRINKCFNSSILPLELTQQKQFSEFMRHVVIKTLLKAKFFFRVKLYHFTELLSHLTYFSQPPLTKCTSL